ncbi:MAG: hypothetical protein HSCHL_2549 [Hydrogenibacillus schlegelii]|uniref:Uncharacterized protein n=1 Tax=Hydrogenibacillus schlegelii TaxID=1484 RepID=A0A2T5G3Q0_HYDSH|nr:MAG: hypothetical protein HSCHL_2549 [Hydrogenibacillus schlegelii]
MVQSKNLWAKIMMNSRYSNVHFFLHLILPRFYMYPESVAKK